MPKGRPSVAIPRGSTQWLLAEHMGARSGRAAAGGLSGTVFADVVRRRPDVFQSLLGRRLKAATERLSAADAQGDVALGPQRWRKGEEGEEEENARSR